MTLSYLLSITWAWLTGTGLTLALLLVIALLIPRVGRFALWFANRRIDANEEGPDEGKTQRALAGVSVYIVQLIAFFILSVFFLQALGFSLTGAAIPATVVSAAIGFGAQSIIADFLAGFFILTEKQFGVGDWVRFEGNGIEVEGTIIQVTMRATRIRTLAQETVIIPNSTARVCINTSNYWSRAVVVIPVPLLGSEDASDAIERSEAATRRALAREEVAAELLGELDVQPAVSIQPPTVVGMPWMVDMRFMIQVTAGNQWMVERAIRSEILDEFWDEYGSATTTTGELRDQLTTAQIPVPQETSGAFAKPPLIDVPVDSPDTETTASTADTEHEATTRITPIPAPRPAAADDTEVMPAAGAKENNPELNPPIPAGHSDEQGRDPARTPSETMDSDEEAREASETKVMDSTADEDAEEVPRWRRILTFGGRLRLSTTILLGLLVILLALRASTVEPTEEWLETRETAEVTEEVEEPTAPAEPTETQPTEPVESPTQAPTATTPQTPTPEGTPTPGTSPTGPAEQPNQTGQQEAPQNTGTTPAPGTPAPQQPAPNQEPAQEPGAQPEQEPAPAP